MSPGRTAAAADYAGELEQQTGDRSLQAALSSGGIDRLNARITQIAAERRDLGLKPLDDDELAKRQAAKSQQAVATYRAIAVREKTIGGSVGFYGGEAAGGITDPVNLLTFPLAAPEALGIVGTAAAWAGIGGGTQAAIEVLGAPYRERIEPGYAASGQPLANIAGAAAFAGGLGGALRGTSLLWDSVKARAWPRAIRDAGNVVESEANVAGSNALPGAAGEVAHRDALGKAIDDIAAGRPVDVTDALPAEMQDAYSARFVPIMDAIAQARADKTGDHAGDVAFELRGIARAAGYAMPRAAADDLAQRLISASSNEAGAILDEFRMRPQTLLETLSEPPATGEVAAATAQPGAPVLNTRAAGAAHDALATELTPERIAAASADTSTDDVVLRNLDRLRAEKPDLAVPVGEAIGTDGQPMPVMRRVDDALTEADARLSAAKEIMDCVGVYPAGAAQ